MALTLIKRAARRAGVEQSLGFIKSRKTDSGQGARLTSERVYGFPSVFMVSACGLWELPELYCFIAGAIRLSCPLLLYLATGVVQWL